MIITAEKFLNDTHGAGCQFLTRQAVIDFAEMYAQKFYASKLQQSVPSLNESYFEEKRKYPDPPKIVDLP